VADVDGDSISQVAKRTGFPASTLRFDDEHCAPAQARLRNLVDAKVAEAQAKAKVVELEAFTAELQRVAATLGVHTPAGPCDDACGCTTGLDVRTSRR